MTMSDIFGDDIEDHNSDEDYEEELGEGEEEEAEVENEIDNPEFYPPATWVYSIDGMGEDDLLDNDGVAWRTDDVSAGFCMLEPKVERAYEQEEAEANADAEASGGDQQEQSGNSDSAAGEAEQTNGAGSADVDADGSEMSKKKRRLTTKTNATAAGSANILKRPAAAADETVLKRPAAKAGATVLKRPSGCGSSGGGVEDGSQGNGGSNSDGGGRKDAHGDAGKEVINVANAPETPRGRDARRDVLKARKFQFLFDSDMLPKVVREEYDEIQKTRSMRGSNCRQRTTDLIEGVMKRDADGKIILDEKSQYCIQLNTKKNKRFLNESFDIYIWEQACNLCGGEAALLSAIERKKCFRRGTGDKPDILWPKVSVGRETTWEQSEQFEQQKGISDQAFNNVSKDFQAIGGDEGFQDLLNFVGGACSSVSPDKSSAIADVSMGVVPVKAPHYEEDLLADDVDKKDKARNELSEQLVNASKTDSLVDKLVAKAQQAKGSSRLERSISELLTTQDSLQDIVHIANKMYKFMKTREGKDAEVIDYKTSAAEIRDQISCLLADTKSVRAHMPKEAK